MATSKNLSHNTNRPARLTRSNAMVAARRMGMAVAFGGTLGTGAFADRIAAALAGEGIDILRPRLAGRDQGCCTVLIDDAGERSFIASEGADGVVMQSKHAPEMTGILAKTACGAADHIPVAYEVNLSRALEKLQEEHYTVIGLDEHAEKTFSELRSYDRAVIVLGAEGPGMRRLVKDHCDVLVKLPTQPPIASLNVSNAAAVALYALLGV